MSEFWNSFSKWFNEKTGSPVYFTYIGFFIAWNWRFFQLVFLEDETLFSSPRIEYILQKLTFTTPISGFWGYLLNLILNLSWKVIPPALLTCGAIMFLPYVHKWALSKYLDSFFERKQLYKQKEKNYNEWLLEFEKGQNKTLDKLVETKQTQAKKKKVILDLTSPEEKRNQEFEKLKNYPLYSGIKDIENVIYENGGATHKWNGTRSARILDSQTLAFADAKGLITIKGRGSDEIIELTNKGKDLMSWRIDNP